MSPITLPPPTARTAPAATPKKSIAPMAQSDFHLTFGAPAAAHGRRVVLFGEGGVGKTTMCAAIPGTKVFIDLDKSLRQLPDLKEQILTGEIAVVQGVEDWTGLLAALNAPGWDNVPTIIIDTATVAEAWATEHVLNTIPKDRGQKATSIEDYGYGKGYRYVADAFDLLLAAIERHTDAGRNVVLVCHSVIQNNTDPVDENFPRYEPRLLHTASGKVSIRCRVREWADDVLFLARDRAVVDGKAVTAENRTVYTRDMGWCMAKSRCFKDAVSLTDPAAFWNALLGE